MGYGATNINDRIYKAIKMRNSLFFQDNAVLAFNAISSIPGLKPIMPQGAMYMMVSIILVRSFPCYLSTILDGISPR